MKTTYSIVIAGLLCLFSQEAFAQLTGHENNENQSNSSYVGNPPGGCSLTEPILPVVAAVPCNISGYAKVIPIYYTEPCEHPQCSHTPTSCPANAQVGVNSSYPFGCFPLYLSILDHSHAHYSPPFLMATFNATLVFSVFNQTIDQIHVARYASKFVDTGCCDF